MKTKAVRDNSAPRSTAIVSTEYEGLVSLEVLQQGASSTAHLTKAQARKVIKALKRAIKECK